jgi:hypothetical protein
LSVGVDAAAVVLVSDIVVAVVREEVFVDVHSGRPKRVPHVGGPVSIGSAKAVVLSKARSQTNTTDLNMFGARINSEKEVDRRERR